jgi:hypothetical protein
LSSLQVSGYVTDEEVKARHKRAVTFQIIAPVAVVAIIMVVVLIAMIAGLSSFQFNTVASFMSLLLLVPAVIVCLVPYVLIVAMLFGTRKLYLKSSSLLMSTRNALHKVNVGATRASRAIARPIIAINMRAAWLETMLERRPRLLSGQDDHQRKY